MKIFFLLLFLSGALLCGCSTNYNYPSKNITVRKTNGIEKEYGLLSVRGDTAIVVLDWAEAKVTPLPFSDAEVIGKDSIAKIVRDGIGGGSNTGLGILCGAALGTGIGVLLSPSPPPQPKNIPDAIIAPLNDLGYQFSKVLIIGGMIILGSVIGGVIGSRSSASILRQKNFGLLPIPIEFFFDRSRSIPIRSRRSCNT
jgi:hypothetical protein